MGIFLIKEQVGIFVIFRIKLIDYLPQTDVPNNEEKPVSHDEFSFPFKTRSVLNIFGHVSEGPPMRPILLKVLDEPLTLHPLHKVLHVVQDVLVQAQVWR